jgi:hypothetical protein
MSDDDIDWLGDYTSELNDMFKNYKNFYAAWMGDSDNPGARKLFDMQNNCFPKKSMDYMNFPQGKYPDRG